MSKSYTIIAFDPGSRTGYCTAHVGERFEPPRGTWFNIIDQGVLTVTDVFDKLPGLVAAADVVAYETWRLYPSHAQVMIGNDMQPSQVVGCIRYEAKQQGKKVLSAAADIKKSAVATMPEWLTKHMAKSSEQHDQDAIMHTWYHAVVRYYRDNARQIADAEQVKP